MNISADRTHPCGFTPTAMRFHLMLWSQTHISVLEYKLTGGRQKYTSAKLLKSFFKEPGHMFFLVQQNKGRRFRYTATISQKFVGEGKFHMGRCQEKH